MPNTAQESVYLASVFPKDARFDARRWETDQFKAMYQSTLYESYADRMRYCSPRLDFALRFEDNGVLSPKLQAAHFCRVRLCPMCQWRRSMMWQAKAFKVIPKIIEAHPKARFIFLTLTVRNCELDELRDTLASMHKAWGKLIKRKEFAPVQGWLRSVEVTRGKDDTAHPHYHALLMVDQGYFKRGYVSQKRWTEIWQSCLGVEYTPIVDVRSVRPGKREKVVGDGVLMSSAICETLKYAVKPSELLQNDSRRRMSNQVWLVQLTHELHKTRAIATGGILRKYLKELEQEPDDLIHADDSGLVEPDQETPRIAFGWRENLQSYVALEESEAIATI